MNKYVKVISVFLSIWLIASIVDVDMHNLSSCIYQKWNIIYIFNNFLQGGTKMYIPPFWCGVAMTIIVEIAALVIYAIYINKKRK